MTNFKKKIHTVTTTKPILTLLLEFEKSVLVVMHCWDIFRPKCITTYTYIKARHFKLIKKKTVNTWMWVLSCRLLANIFPFTPSFTSSPRLLISKYKQLDCSQFITKLYFWKMQKTSHIACEMPQIRHLSTSLPNLGYCLQAHRMVLIYSRLSKVTREIPISHLCGNHILN